MGIGKSLAGYAERHDIRKLANKLNMAYPTVARILNENDSYDLGIKKLIFFIEATRETWKDPGKKGLCDFALLDEIELRLGRIAREVETPKHDFSFHGLSRLIKESSEATRTISEAFADGRVTPREASDCIKDLKDLIYICVQLVQSLEAIESKGEDFHLR